MGWILLWTMPLVQDRSLDALLYVIMHDRDTCYTYLLYQYLPALCTDCDHATIHYHSIPFVTLLYRSIMSGVPMRLYHNATWTYLATMLHPILQTAVGRKFVTIYFISLTHDDFLGHWNKLLQKLRLQHRRNRGKMSICNKIIWELMMMIYLLYRATSNYALSA